MTIMTVATCVDNYIATSVMHIIIAMLKCLISYCSFIFFF